MQATKPPPRVVQFNQALEAFDVETDHDYDQVTSYVSLLTVALMESRISIGTLASLRNAVAGLQFEVVLPTGCVSEKSIPVPPVGQPMSNHNPAWN